MTALPTLDSEITDLGLALGLLVPSGGGGFELDSTWFDDPGARLAGALGDGDRRAALERFAEAVLAQGTHTERDGVTLLRLFDLRSLANQPSLPDLTVHVSLDDRPAGHVEVGLAVTFRTEAPATTTDLVVPLYRATKKGASRPAEQFALLDGGVVQLATELTLSTAAPPPGDFGLAGVSASIATALTGPAAPRFGLVLHGLHLPGAATSSDLVIGGGHDLTETLLSLVLGLVRQGADALAGPLADEVGAALDLLGLGDAAAIPALPVDQLLAHGASALRAWFTAVMGDQGARGAWLGAVARLMNGTPSSGGVTIPIPGGPVAVTLGLAALPGPSGHLVVTPRLGLTFTQDVAGAVRLGAEAVADLLTIDTATGALTTAPRVDVVLTATGSGTGDAAKLLHTSEVDVGALRVGLSLVGGEPQALVQMLDVDLASHHHDVLDLSNADAVVASVGQVAADLVGAVIDALGDAAADIKGLLGLVPTGGMPALDARHLLTDPLGTLAGWWHDLLTGHAADVPAVLARLRNLIAGPLDVLLPIAAADPNLGPWTIPVAGPLAIDVALTDGVLAVAPVLSLRVDDLAGGCTVVTTALRVRLATLDMTAKHATFPLAVDLRATMRARGATEARLGLGPVAIRADHIGLHASWSPAAGLDVGLVAPGLAVVAGEDVIPLVLPTVDADGHVNVPPSAWASVEALLGVLAAASPFGWLTDLVDLAGWNLSDEVHGIHLSLQDMASQPAAALQAWFAALTTNTDVLGSLVSTVAHLTGGSRDGLFGAFDGSGTPDDPWRASLTRAADAPSLAVWLAPHGPVLAAALAEPALIGWRPGMPGLPIAGLVRGLLDEALAGDDAAGLAAGRENVAVGLDALVGRWVGTDGLVAPSPAPIAGVTTVVRDDVDHVGVAELDPATLLAGGLPAGAVVLRVAIATAAAAVPWSAAPGRLLDLTTPAVTPASFTVADPAAGEWVIALAPRADATLGGAEDPSGLVGQSARLVQVIRRFRGVGPVVLVALGGAGHAARLAADHADAVGVVTHLVTLGTPWSPATFDTARTGVPADALRLLHALVPTLDPTDPDDPDLGLGRHLAEGFMAAVRGAPGIADLEAPQPVLAVRGGLAVVAAFGALGAQSVGRALTAVFAAGLSARARARLGAANAEPTTAHVAMRVPFAWTTPPGGHGLTVQGAVSLSFGEIDLGAAKVTARPSVVVELGVADTDGWLLGGPGTTPTGGALPLELRRVDARVEVGVGGAASTATLTLHEGAALGADFARLLVAPPTDATGTLDVLPLLPEAQALVSALVGKLGAALADSPARRLADLLRAIGVTQPDGALVPDALAHLLHDPAAYIRSLLSTSADVAAPRAALVAALAGLVPGTTASSAAVHLAVGPLTLDADLAARTVGFSANGRDGVLPWSAGVQFDPTGRAALSATLGDPLADAFALTVRTIAGPSPSLVAELTRAAPSAPVALFPSPDVDGLVRLASVALPAEAVRLVLDALRRVDTGLGAGLDDLADAIGLLAPADANGHRAYRAPVQLFDDPVSWFRRAGVLALTDGGPFDAERIITLLDALKPFVGLTGTPRGTWPITNGVTLVAASGGDGPVLTLAVDATAWLAGLAGRAPVAAGVSLGLALAGTGAPRPTVELFVGVPDGSNGTSTPQHRRAAHLVVSGNQLRVVLRPSTGDDIELYPNSSGFGSLLSAGVTEVLPFVLTRLAAMTGDTVRTEVAEVVGAVGRGLGLAAGTPAVFDGTQLKALATAPVPYLRTRLGTLLAEAVTAIDVLAARLLGLGAGQHGATIDGSGAVTVVVRTVAVVVRPSPLSVTVLGAATGLPVIGTAELSLAIDPTGIVGWSAGFGPAVIDLDGPVVRPFVRAGSTGTSGWQVDVGLGLDALVPSVTGHRELAARWREASGLGVLVTTRTGATTVAEDASPAAVAAAAIDAVLELVGGWVLGVTEVRTLLATAFGTNTTTVKSVLEGSILAAADPPRLLPGVLTGWPGKLLTLASKLATAAPSVPVGPLTIGITSSGGVLGIVLSTANNAGIDLTASGDITLRLDVDASWIEPPGGPAPAPGIVLDVLKVDGANLVPAPGISANGVGLRIGRSSGPLLDAGLRLDTVAVHLFGHLRAVNGTPELAGGVQLELGGLAVPLGNAGGDNAVAKGIMRDAGGSGAPPRPAFSPALAVQDHGDGVAFSLRAGPDPGPWFLPIQRAFGPVYIDQVGLGVAYKQNRTPRQVEMISVLLDGSVSLLGLTASVEKLRLGYHVSRPFFSPASWEVDVEGFAIAADFGPLSLAGALVKFPLDAPPGAVEYLGMLRIRYGTYGVDLFGGYAYPTDPSGAGFASFFAFGVLHAPLGGVPAFFVTGIGIGFGINRELRTPSIDEVTTHPFMQALRAIGPAPEPMQQLKDMRALVKPASGEFWVAAGISFTSFVLITGEILVTVQFGDGLEIAVLGVARAELPAPGLTLVSIELALLARFSTKEGLLLVQAQLTENSWLLDRSVRLTGGFAFATWWRGPNAGQFVVTVGGYHPRFHHDGYPVVPRVGLRWKPADFISIEGGVYFALCSEAIMAGAGMHVAAHLGPAHATLDFGGDGIVFFDPFFFSVRVYAEARVGITIWLLFGSVDIDVSLGFDVTVEGPPIHVHGRFSVCGIGIPFEFGERSNPADRALDAGEFEAKYLRGDSQAQVVQAAVLRGGLLAGKSSAPQSGGVAKPPDGSVASPFRVVPEFVMSFVTIVPSTRLAVVGGDDRLDETLPDPGLGVAPMYSPTLASALEVTIAPADGQDVDVQGMQLVLRPAAAFPKGVWGPAGNPDAKLVPAGDTVDACDGFSIDTRLPDAKFTGAPPVDYHQVELPLRGRKPLPFVTNRAKADARVGAANALKAAAAVLTAGNPDADGRFARAARVLAAAGTGLTSVSALRGERVAPPAFGSLADDLDLSPDAISTAVTPVVVDRTPPAARRVAPLVKSVVGVPMSITLDRPSGTTVREPGAAVGRVAPQLASVQAAFVGRAQLALQLVPRAAAATATAVGPIGAAPVTRLASGTVGAVANAQPGAAASRLAAMTAGLVPAPSPVGSRRRATALTARGADVHDGELAVITIANRPTGDVLDTVVVDGAVRTRVLCMAAGGLVLDDRVVGDDGAAQASVTVPRATERIAVVALGANAAVGGTVPGWYAGQSLPTVGWSAALGGGVVASAQGTRVPHHRERGDGGWVAGRELAAAVRVVTTFTDPVDAIAVVVDDAIGGDAAAEVSMRLADAERAVDGSGTTRPPRVLVDGVRSILLYEVRTTGPNPRVTVDGCTSGQLAGVLGWSSGAAALEDALAVAGVAAAVQPPLVGGPGSRSVTVVLGDDTPPRPTGTAKASRAKKAATSKATTTGAAPASRAKKATKKATAGVRPRTSRGKR